ncbi:AAA family ATPase [Paraliomyxa miuraensis]|uniref:AAA family ATPase n=1 Tax=Paraliomyxa miuraensis TaxID=376150 RepID=UPI00224E4A53|nr:AAA family ATPase [Paraliomyxa miuraensis]MCX4242097.1 ATP-binding protein [Paraliomyxa miuraensis]
MQLPIGISDFRELREKGLTYVDKSGLIVEMLDHGGSKVLLLPRPRRFGKTLALSMLRCFFERQRDDLRPLFHDLAVWRAGDAYRQHFGRYPVVYLTFRDAKASTFEACQQDLFKKIQVLYREHRAVLDGGVLEVGEARDYQAILDDTAEPVLYRRALGELSRYLHRATGERTIVLIDEYDEPIHAGFVHGYGAQVIELYRAFLTNGLKDNPHLERGVVTGVLRVSRESIFSGLNNLAVHTLLQRSFSSCFGFTEAEVVALMAQAGRSGQLELVRTWYDGYDFGGAVIYNPWSVLCYLADDDAQPRPHWLNTSSNDLVQRLLQGRAAELHEPFSRLLAGEGVERILDENVVLDRLDDNDDALWSLLVFSGYLRAERRPPVQPSWPPPHRLSIPNAEVRLLYTSTFQQWMKARMKGHGGQLERLLSALLSGDALRFEQQLSAFVLNVLSYHDLRPDEPERIYQVFVLGLLAALEPGHRVRSNRESGKGRPDVMVIPVVAGQPGVVLELKVVRKGQTLERVLDDGWAQAHAMDYAAELRAAGAEPVHVLVVAFDGKTVRVRGAEG